MPDRNETDPQVRIPMRHLAASIVGVWLCYFLLTTLRGAVVGLEMQDALLWRRALVTLAGMAITLVLWLVLRPFEQRALWVKMAAALLLSLPAAIMVAQVNALVFADIEDRMIQTIGKKAGVNMRRDQSGNILVDIPGLPSIEEEEESEAATARSITIISNDHQAETIRQLTDVAIGRYFLLLAWCALYLAMLAGAQARAAERRGERFRSAAKAAELRSLRYQVNPHFLFNTLNSLSALVMTGKGDRAEQMIQTMSSFYRHSLAESPTADVPLADEFELQRHYLDIEKVRFPDRLKTRFELPVALEEIRVPGMILQPLVENSVKYAVAPHNRPVTITLSAERDGNDVVLSVCDDGPGGDEVGEHGFGIGLANVRDRLRTRYGEGANVSAAPADDGYCTRLRIPVIRHD